MKVEARPAKYLNEVLRLVRCIEIREQEILLPLEHISSEQAIRVVEEDVLFRPDVANVQFGKPLH